MYQQINKSTNKLINQSGQALVLVLLSLAVVLTIVLFVLARSVTDIAVSSRSEEAVRAFSAAEAGIENALVIGTGTGATPAPIGGGDARYTSAVAGFAKGATEFNYPLPMLSGDSMTTWFVSHLANGTLGCDADNPCYTGSQITVCWGESGTSQSSPTTPAVEASIFYETTPEDPATVQIKRVTADPSSVGRTSSNSFGAASGGSCPLAGAGYAFNKAIDFGGAGLNIPAGSRLLFARVRILYNTAVPQPVGVSVSGGTLPSQGQDIVSTGSAGDSNRKVAVFQGWPEPPSVFDYSIYSGTGLTK